MCVFIQDWQQGGKSEVYLWGNGRHGQLAEAGTNVSVPTLAPSLSQTQQVWDTNLYDLIAYTTGRDGGRERGTGSERERDKQFFFFSPFCIN